MNEENMNYPLHLGVTEAGDGEDARVKSAIGIGTLLYDGLERHDPRLTHGRPCSRNSRRPRSRRQSNGPLEAT